MTTIPILFFCVALVAIVLGSCANLPVAAASALKELIATCLAFSAITAIACRGLLARGRDSEGG